MIKISIDTKNINRRLNRTIKSINESGNKNVNLIGRLIRDRLKLYMPKKTGESARSIIVKDLKTTARGSSLTVSQGFIPHPEKIGMHGYRGQHFNIPRWALTSRKARKHFKTGNIQALRQVIPSARREFGIRIRNDITKSIKK